MDNKPFKSFEDQIKILKSRNLNFIEEIDEDLKAMIIEMFYLFLAYRNRADHGGRLYNFRSESSKINYHERLHSKMGCTRENYDKGLHHSNLAVLVASLGFFKSYGNLQTNLAIKIYNAQQAHTTKYPDDIEFITNTIEIKFSN